MDKDTTKREPEDEGSDNEEMPKEAAEAQAEVLLSSQKNKHENENKKNRNKLLIIAAITLLIGGVVFYLLLGNRSENTEDSANTDQAEVTNETPEAPVDVADDFAQIVYSYAPDFNSPRALYSRPAVGGDRNDLDFNFGRDGISRISRSMESYALIGDDSIVYFGTGLDEPRSVYTVAENVEVGGMDLSDDATSILLTTIERVGAQGHTVIGVVIDLSNDTSRTLFTRTGVAGGIIVEYWNSANDSFLGYETQCWGCDGGTNGLAKFSSSGEINPDVEFKDIEFVDAVNSDGTKALYTEATIFTAEEASNLGLGGGIGDPQGAPYTIMVVDLKTGLATQLATVGASDDPLNEFGYFDSPRLAWADSDDGQRPAYSYGTKLFVQNQQGNFDNWFETSQNPITSILAIDEDELLVGSRLDDGSTISYFNVDTQEGAIVMETTNTTNILSVVRK